MSSPQLETFLARLYTDALFRAQFLNDPQTVTSSANLTADELKALNDIDRIGLQMASTSIAFKRNAYAQKRKKSSFVQNLLCFFNLLAKK